MTGPAAFPNFRVLGGQRTADGRRVRDGLVYRSEAVLDPTLADAAWIADLGIALVCDLRSATERAHAPNAWWRARGVEPLDLDLLAALPPEHRPWPALRADPTAQGARTAMHSVYAGLPAAAAAPIATLFGRIAAGELPVLIHCTAGKDRTGFLSAVLLASLGVPQPAIVADYLTSLVPRSAAAVAATRAMVAGHLGADPPAEALAVMMGLDDAYLATAFGVIARDHVGIAGYLAAAGLSADQLDRLRARLLE